MNSPISIRRFEKLDTEAVVRLWERCFLRVPHNDPYEDIKRKLSHSPEGFLVAEKGKSIVGSIMAGYDGHRGWLNYLAVDPGCQGLALGKRLTLEAESILMPMGCPKINLQVRETNAAVMNFYEQVGYKQEQVASMGKRLVDDLEP